MSEIGKEQPSVEALTARLVAYDSVSHHSNGAISDFVSQTLDSLGFDIERHIYRDLHGQQKVSLVAKRGPNPGGVAYSAHTDVVPADDWSTGFNTPFEPVVRDGKLYGRGACDMKGSLACAITAASKISQTDQRKAIYFIISADEEIGMQGARQIDAESKWFQEMVEQDVVGIIGEPTELGVVHAHKGGQGYIVRARGESAHTSTGKGLNANHQLIPALPSILALREKSESDLAYRNQTFDPPTLSWNMILINEPQAVNVTPSLAELQIFIRTMPEVDHSPLVQQLEAIAREHRLEMVHKGGTSPWGVEPSSDWILDMSRIVGEQGSETVCFATDAGVLQRLRKLMICGPGSIAQAHRSDEWIAIDQLRRGVTIYEQAFRRWVC